MEDYNLANDTTIQQAITNIQQSLEEGSLTLEEALDSSIKHLPAYLKIVKTHLFQLRQVLSLESHNSRTLETAGLAKPVKQLINLFDNLADQDLQSLELLTDAAKKWSHENLPKDETQDKIDTSKAIS